MLMMACTHSKRVGAKNYIAMPITSEALEAKINAAFLVPNSRVPDE
jgi:hypothetical protein